MEGVINSRHAPLVWKSNPSSVYPRLSSPRTIISTPFGERRRFSLCRLVHNLDRSLRAPCSCCCCNCCFCCCFSQRRKAAELSCYSFRDVTRLAVIFSTIHLDARLFIYTTRWGKVGGEKTVKITIDFSSEYVTQCEAKVNDDLKLDPTSFLPPARNISIFFFKR